MKMQPDRFCDEVFSAVNDLVEDKFLYFFKEASERLHIKEEDEYRKLGEGSACVTQMVTSELYPRLEKWKEYCLRVCFRVPEDSRPLESINDFPLTEDALSYTVQDEELETLRGNLTKAIEESGKLSDKLHSLKQKYDSKSQQTLLINEVIQLKNELSIDDMFQELVEGSTTLSSNIEKLGCRWMDDRQKEISKLLCDQDTDSAMEDVLPEVSLEDIRTLLFNVKGM